MVLIIGRQQFIRGYDFEILIENSQAAFVIAIFVIAIGLQPAQVVFGRIFLKDSFYQFATGFAIFNQVIAVGQLHFILNFDL